MSKQTVFLVDDNEIFLKTLSFQISDHFGDKVEVKAFGSGEAALEEIDLKPALVVLDFNLDEENPGAMDGVEVLKKMRKVVPYLSVIILSGQKSYGVALNSIVKGAAEYLIKEEGSGKEIIKRIEKLLK